MKIIFLAYTQYHLINILNLKLNNHIGDDCSLVLLNKDVSNIDGIYHNLKDKGIFSNIYLINNPPPAGPKFNKFIAHIKTLVNAVKNKIKVDSFFDEEECDIFYSFGSSIEGYLILDKLKKKNNHIKYVNYEEGLGSYYHRADNSLNLPVKLFLKNFLRISMPEYPDEFLVYLPECVSVKMECPIKSMPVLKRNKKTIELFNQVFGYRNIEPPCNSIIFEQSIGEIDLQLIEIFHLFKEKSVCVKMHPRSNNIDNYSDMTIYEANNCPWEVICLNNHMSDKVLIAYFSTTCATPKSLFDEEPIIIYLFNIEELRMKIPVDAHKLEFIRRLKNTYKDKTRVYIPESTEELMKIINKLNL